MLDAITGMIREIKRVEASGSTVATVVMVYVCIDAMAALTLPQDREVQTKADYIAWVDRYMKGHEDQPYQYRGIDVYGARCAMLHSYSSEVDFHEREPDSKVFGYTDGGMRLYDPEVDPRLVLMGVASLVNDFVIAVEEFFKDMQSDADFRARVASKLPKVLLLHPLPELRSKE